MKLLWPLLAFNLLASDVTIRIDTPTPTNVIITITLPEAQTVQFQTNVVRTRTQTVLPDDARASLPRSVPAPPVSLLAMRALPGGTNLSYRTTPMPPAFPDRKIIWIKDWAGNPKDYTFKALVPLPE